MFNIQCDADCNTLKPQAAEEEEGGERRRLDSPQECVGAKQVTGYKCVVDDSACKLKSLCELQTDTSKCEKETVPSGYKCVKENTACKLVSTSTNSSNILNIFKVTFILLFIFTIL
jgi:hypothetical protein